jgi:NAD(P)-dependent dehydrogenase (short-subunit alcohol dehydrogenase family)
MPPDFASLQGRVALVTGAGSGIGQATALRLAAAGVKVAALDRTRRDLQETCGLITKAGGEVLPLAADVARTAPMRRALDRVRHNWGRLHIVFANAGINGVWAGLDKLRPAEWDRTIAVNLRGTFLTVKFALPLMRRNGGAVILTSSVQGTRMFSNSGASAYATSKAGQVAFGRMCALELAAHHIRVNTICPGAIRTHIGAQTTVRDTAQQLHLPVKFPRGTIPLTTGRPGSADQIADLVLFLASDAASHVTGTEVFIDGAESLLLG